MKYYLGIDNGGTNTKAALFDENGAQLCCESIRTETILPAPGFVERDMEEMWQANCHVIRQAITRSGIEAKSISAVAICGHGKGLYLWGKDDQPAYHGIASTDNRAYALPERWNADGTTARVWEMTLQKTLACQPVSLLAWLKEHEPTVYENIRYVFSCKDYIRFRLTGEARAERTDFSGANLLNLRTGEYDCRILEQYGIADIYNTLPPLCDSLTIAGYVTREAANLTGLLEGTPVAGGMFDIDACALAVGVSDSTKACMIAGTWSINEYPSPKPVIRQKDILNSLFCIPGYYLVEESSPTSASNSEWMLDTLLRDRKLAAAGQPNAVYELMDKWIEETEASTFTPVYLPFLSGSNVHPNAKACFVGLTTFHDQRHICRSVYEGVAFSHKYHYEKLLQNRSEPFDCIRLAGGAAKSRAWTQMFADILEMPIEVVAVDETGAAGCAIAAAIAVNDVPSIEAALSRFIHVRTRVEPNPDSFSSYRKKYALYLNVIASLDSIWSQMQEMTENA